MLSKVIKLWFPLAIVVTLLSGIIYIVAQQSLRQGANDPQIQIAQETAQALASGQSVQAVMPATQVDIAQSLAPFVTVFDDSGQVLATSGLLHNQPPALPSGVFDYVRQNQEDRISWQPEPGVRSAAVIARYTGAHSGFVLAGRSLREVENRIDQLGTLVGLGCLGTLFASLVGVVLLELAFAGNPRSRTSSVSLGSEVATASK